MPSDKSIRKLHICFRERIKALWKIAIATNTFLLRTSQLSQSNF
uniref:Uncharacterized protein n=1 Tax=Rhizophora mucronata TaxID=61149 RepID=A0A2P2P5S3_RHIMU